MLTNTVNKIKSWVEKWQHRLQGHMLMTVKAPNGHTSSEWITAVYTDEFGAIMIDFCDSDDSDRIGQKSVILDITITGA